jgi:hypothetical protein
VKEVLAMKNNSAVGFCERPEVKRNAPRKSTRFCLVTIPLSLVTMLSALTGGCSRGLAGWDCRSPSGAATRCVGLRLTFKSSESFDAWSIFETREVDPAVYDHDPETTSVGTLKITLNTGAVVSHSQALYRDLGTTVQPVTPGYRVLVYRPANPAALQNFINQYKAQAVSAEINTTVSLRDVSNGTVSSSVVDTQGRYNSSLEYIGSVVTEPPARERGPIEY